MKRRTYLRALIWIAPALVLGGYVCFRFVRESLLRSAVERAVARATGAEILVLDPLARDYEANLRHIALALAAALQPKL